MSSDVDNKSLQSEINKASQKETQSNSKPDAMLILSGGEGYIDFRIGKQTKFIFHQNDEDFYNLSF